MDAVNHRTGARTGDDLTDDDVAAYLKRNPGFFLRREDLLPELELTHPSGSAVSLLERQVSLLRERNVDMRQRLAGLVENARRNDQLFERTRTLVLALLEAHSADAIARVLREQLLEEFGVHYAAFTLLGDPRRHRGVRQRMVPVAEAQRHIEGLLRGGRAVCGVLREEELRFLFGEQATAVSSAAVVPLGAGQPLGVLAIGSRDPEHFRSSMGTLFLGYIAEVLNRLLPRYLRDG